MMKKIKNIRPLIIGIGTAGRRHLEAQLSLGFKTGVYTRSPETARSLRENTNVILFDNLDDAIDWSNLVHVCTPDDKHTEFVAQAVKNGKAVLCEKSFTTRLDDALYLQKLAREYDSLLIIGQNYRLTPSFEEIKKRVSAGELGTIRKIETTYLHDKNQYKKRKPLRKNEDFLYIGGSHAVDLACWITEDKAVSVIATLDGSDPKTYEIVLKFASGLSAYIKLDAASPRPYNGSDLIVSGTKGRMESNNKIDNLCIYNKELKKIQVLVFPNTKTYTTASEVNIINNYLSGKSDSYSPLPDVDEAVNIIRILDAIEKSAVSKRPILII